MYGYRTTQVSRVVSLFLTNGKVHVAKQTPPRPSAPRVSCATNARDLGSLLRLSTLETMSAARRSSSGEDVASLAGELNIVVGELAELGIIQTHLLLLSSHTERQARDEVHEEEDDAGKDKRVRETGDRVRELVAELDVVLVDPATGDLAAAIEMGNVVAKAELAFDNQSWAGEVRTKQRDQSSGCQQYRQWRAQRTHRDPRQCREGT